jgi:hypothetical protein
MRSGLAAGQPQLSEEISEADHEIAQLVGEVAPDLLSFAVSVPRSPASS